MGQYGFSKSSDSTALAAGGHFSAVKSGHGSYKPGPITGPRSAGAHCPVKGPCHDHPAHPSKEQVADVAIDTLRSSEAVQGSQVAALISEFDQQP
jgi:hypothetical protein